jgi:hypothetical protein
VKASTQATIVSVIGTYVLSLGRANCHTDLRSARSRADAGATWSARETEY